MSESMRLSRDRTHEVLYGAWDVTEELPFLVTTCRHTMTGKLH